MSYPLLKQEKSQETLVSEPLKVNRRPLDKPHQHAEQPAGLAREAHVLEHLVARPGRHVVGHGEARDLVPAVGHVLATILRYSEGWCLCQVLHFPSEVSGIWTMLRRRNQMDTNSRLGPELCMRYAV